MSASGQSGMHQDHDGIIALIEQCKQTSRLPPLLLTLQWTMSARNMTHWQPRSALPKLSNTLVGHL